MSRQQLSRAGRHGLGSADGGERMGEQDDQQHHLKTLDMEHVPRAVRDTSSEAHSKAVQPVPKDLFPCQCRCCVHPLERMFWAWRVDRLLLRDDGVVHCRLWWAGRCLLEAQAAHLQSLLVSAVSLSPPTASPPCSTPAVAPTICSQPAALIHLHGAELVLLGALTGGAHRGSEAEDRP
jgi:hypothetical protein